MRYRFLNDKREGNEHAPYDIQLLRVIGAKLDSQ